MSPKRNFFNVIKESWGGLLAATLIGATAYAIKYTTNYYFADPLLIALIMGIVIRSVLGKRKRWERGFTLAPQVFIPIGIIFYGAKNLNFIKYAKVDAALILVLFLIILVYFAVIFALGKWLKQKKEITYLTATGSAICGASAIAITSPVVEADADDVSISLLSVALVGLVGLFIIFPFLAIMLDMTNKTYGLMAGSVLQFTGFVKAAVGDVSFLNAEITSKELYSLAVSVKAVRYLGLLIAIPLFASLVKKRVFLPWYLWVFLIAGIAGSWTYVWHAQFYSQHLIPFIKPIYGVSWAIAMGAIGLNADIKKMLSNNGTKALIMALAGFAAAITVFLISLRIIYG